MRAYGKRRRDGGCCPGHDKYSPDRYNSKRCATRRRQQRPRKKSARQRARALITSQRLALSFYEREGETLAGALSAIVDAATRGASGAECGHIARTTLELAGSDRGG